VVTALEEHHIKQERVEEAFEEGQVCGANNNNKVVVIVVIFVALCKIFAAQTQDILYSYR
jgi:hypothetical protein